MKERKKKSRKKFMRKKEQIRKSVIIFGYFKFFAYFLIYLPPPFLFGFN